MHRYSSVAVAIVLVLLATVGSPASAVSAADMLDPDSARLCGRQLVGDVELTAQGLQLRTVSGSVVIAAGHLWLNGTLTPLTAHQQAVLKHYDRLLQGVVPAVAEAARVGLSLGLETTLAALAEPGAAAAELSPEQQQSVNELHSRLSSHWPRNSLSARALAERQLDRDIDALITSLTELLLRPLPMAGATTQRHVATPVSQLQPVGDAGALLQLCADVAKLDALENTLGLFELFTDNHPSI